MDWSIFVKALTLSEINELHNALWKIKKEYATQMAQELTQEEKNLVNTGNWILAIKHYRARLGVSLLEAKIAVEVYKDRN